MARLSRLSSVLEWSEPSAASRSARVGVQAHGLVVQPQAQVGSTHGFQERPFGRPRPGELLVELGLARSITSATLTSRPVCSGSGLRNASTRKVLTASACRRDSSDCARAASVACLASLASPRACAVALLAFLRALLARASTPAAAPSPTTPASSATSAAATAVRLRRAHRRAPGEGLAPGRNRLVGHPAIQVVGQGLGRWVAVFELGGHGLEADGLQGLVERRIDQRRPCKLPLLHDTQNRPDVLPLKRRLTGQEAVEGGTQTVNVGPRAQPIQLARGLLRAHVSRSSQRAAR